MEAAIDRYPWRGCHPGSVVRGPDGRLVALKAHRATWSGRYPPNSLAGVRECYRAHVATAEVDVWLLSDQDLAIVHDDRPEVRQLGRMPIGSLRRAQLLRLPVAQRPPLLSELVELIRREPFPTRLELDVKDEQAWPWDRVEEVVGLLGPVHDRVLVAGTAGETLRRVAAADHGLAIGFNPQHHLRQLAPGRMSDWLRHLRSLVPTARQLHLSLRDVNRLRKEGTEDIGAICRAHGWTLDAWTLNYGTSHWAARLDRLLEVGPDVITTDTAMQLAGHLRGVGRG